MADNTKYMTNGVAYSEQQAPGRSNWLRVDMLAFGHDLGSAGSHELKVKVYTYDNDVQEIHFDGTLTELIELVLLGKVMKDKVQKDAKVCQVSLLTAK